MFNTSKEKIMKNNQEGKVWLITGAGRGMGVDIAKAALAARHNVVATGRNIDKVAMAIGQAENLLVVKLDVTNPADAEAAVQAAVERFGAVDVLVNNAANFYAGFFEEFTPEQLQAQMNTNFFGPLNVTRAVLPLMRQQGSGHIISISSTAGIFGYEQCSMYSASKFALEGWMDALRIEVAPFGIKTTVVNPGFFRTTLLEPESTTWAENAINDYAERNARLRAGWESMNGNQSGDPEKLANALVTLTDQAEPPMRWFAGADAVSEGERKASELQGQIEPYRAVSCSLAVEDSNVKS
jgi:NAD(P)-dependent dehydrogenase (short-subunit alcohol dehydrogenase family)